MRKRTFLSFFLLLAFPFVYHSFGEGTGEGPGTRIAFDKLSETQLLNLIDSLFELDNAPPDLVNDLSVFIRSRHSATESPAVAASPEYIHPLDAKTIFSNEMEAVGIDSSFSVVLSAADNEYFTLPFTGLITSRYGWRENEFHKGIDIDLNKGDTVRCVMAGMVRVAKKHQGYGNMVIVSHPNGLETLYAHLSKLKVAPGQMVSAGELLGLGGSTGKSTGSHLHFEIRFKGEALNPQFFVSFEEGKMLGSSFCVKKTKWGCTAFPENACFHVIERGDNLFEIAKRYGTTPKKVKELNCMSRKTVLKVGQKIRVS